MTTSEFKAKLIAEIESFLRCYFYEEISEEALQALDKLKDFINSLPEEPVCYQDDVNQTVTEDLEEAAIEICSKILKGETVVIDGYEYVVLSDAEECFKAGAKWQAEQDLALSWKDIGAIISLDQQVCAEWGISKYTHHHKEAMEEVLKRFNEQKGGKV